MIVIVAVAQADVEKPIRPKEKLAAIMGYTRLRNGKHGLLARRIGAVGVARYPKDGDAVVARDIVIVDKEPPAEGVVGCKGEAEKALLAAIAHHLRSQIEERCRQDGAAFDHADCAALLHDKQSVVARRRCQVEREVESRRDLLKCQDNRTNGRSGCDRND